VLCRGDLAAGAGHLVAAEDAGAAVGVDRDHAGAQTTGHTHDIAAPDAAGQTVLVGVRLANDLVLVHGG